MTRERHPAWEIYYAAERDVRSALAKISELGIQLANLSLADPLDVNCPLCGLKTKGPRSLSEHLYNSHDGEVPETWERAEKLAD